MEKYEKISATQIKITRTDENIVDIKELQQTAESYNQHIAELNDEKETKLKIFSETIENEYSPKITTMQERLADINKILNKASDSLEAIAVVAIKE